MTQLALITRNRTNTLKMAKLKIRDALAKNRWCVLVSPQLSNRTCFVAQPDIHSFLPLEASLGNQDR